MQAPGGSSLATRNLSSVIITPDQDNQSILTTTVAQGTSAPVSNMEQSILQGTLQGSAAVGEKRSNTDSASSFMSRRRINACITSCRRQAVRNVSQTSQNRRTDIMHGLCELDSHADTCVAGANCIILETTNMTVSVSAFSDTHEVIHDVPIVTAATAYDNPRTGDTVILIFGQAIYLGDQIQASLLCPNQLRAHGVTVDDIPRHLAPPDRPSNHSIYCPDDELNIPLSLKGIISYFNSRTPTQEELNTCKWVILTDEHEWDPHSEFFQEQENNFQSLQNNHQIHDRHIYSVHSQSHNPIYHNMHSDVSHSLDDSSFVNLRIASTMTSQREFTTTAEVLAQNWNIGLETAKRTLQVTTQKGIRSSLNPVEQRYRTKQAQLRYKQLAGRHGRFYTDTFFANTPTLNGCKIAQLYTNVLRYTCSSGIY